MKVKLAAQVFSQRVSSAMRFSSKDGILPKECQDTADFLLIFDKLFDFLMVIPIKMIQKYINAVLKGILLTSNCGLICSQF